MINLPLTRGDLNSPIVVIGDSPSYADQENGQYLSSDTFETIERMFEQAGISVEQCLFVAIGDRPCPRKGGYSPEELKRIGEEQIAPLIAAYPRRQIISCGNAAAVATGFLSTKKGLNDLRMNNHTLEIASKNGEIIRVGREVEVDTGDFKEVKSFPIAFTSSLFVLVRDPETFADFYRDLKYVSRFMRGDYSELPPIEIRWIKTPQDVRNLEENILKRGGRCAYDVETSGLHRDRVVLFTNAFYFGETNERNEPVVYFYAVYDKLIPLMDDDLWDLMDTEWERLYSNDEIAWIAHNNKYDDMVIRAAYDVPRFRSTVDTRIRKWIIDPITFSSLKGVVTTYLGYVRYDGELDDKVAEIKKRRENGKHLTHEDDLRALDFIGATPKEIVMKTKTKYAWPVDEVDILECAYGLVDMDILSLYNCYDAYFTWELDVLFGNMIRKEGLEEADDFRHFMGDTVFEMTETGVLVDRKTNEEFIVRCVGDENDPNNDGGLRGRALTQCRQMLKEKGWDKEFVDNFNPNSDHQVRKIVFGEPVDIPLPDSSSILDIQNENPDNNYPWMYRDRDSGELKMSYRKFDELYDQIVELAYGPGFREYREYGTSFDLDRAVKIMQKEWRSYLGTAPEMCEVEMYITTDVQPTKYTKTGLPSVNRKVLEEIYSRTKDEWLRVFLMYRKVDKLYGTFIEGIHNKLGDDDILHVGYNEIGPRGGRISSNSPNGQNFPKYLRGQIIPRPGMAFVTWDLKQLEVRLLAAFCQDPSLIEQIATGMDLHRVFASRIFNKEPEEVTDQERQYSKMIVFAVIYGVSMKNLAEMLQMSIEAVEEIVEKFNQAFPMVQVWKDRQINEAYTSPFYTYTCIGTRRTSIGTQSPDFSVRGKAERVACNQPIQGTGGEYTFWCADLQSVLFLGAAHCAYYDEPSDHPFIQGLANKLRQVPGFREIIDNLVEKYGFFLRPALTVHDSFTFEVAEELAELFSEVCYHSFAQPCPWGAISTVKIEGDVTIEYNWDGKPDLLKAIDPAHNTEKELFPWYLIDPASMDKEDRQEVKDLETE